MYGARAELVLYCFFNFNKYYVNRSDHMCVIQNNSFILNICFLYCYCDDDDDQIMTTWRSSESEGV